MNRLFRLLLCALLLTAFGPGDVCAQSAAPAAKNVAKTAKTSPARQKQAKGKARSGKKVSISKAEKPLVTEEELTQPYSASSVFGPPAPPPNTILSGTDNASRLDFDPTPKARPFAKPEDTSPISLHIGPETVVDPLNKQNVTSSDPKAAKESLEKMDLKGALDKVGGKAEVQVDILKF